MEGLFHIKIESKVSRLMQQNATENVIFYFLQLTKACMAMRS